MISWQILNKLEKEFGDSFFILDIRQFEDNYKNFLESFRSIYPNTNLGYSYKTNYIPKICQSVHKLGGYAEVVSQMEYELAIAIGVQPSQIIFNGPLKQQSDIEKAIIAGSIVNLDCIEEVEIVEALANKFPDKQISVGLRCNFDIGAGRISRFGFDTASNDLDYAFKRLGKLDNCSVQGFHCHISSSSRSIESYALRTKKILELSNIYFPDKPPRYIDVGGGFFGNMTEDLKAQFDTYIPNYKDYANAVATQLKERFPNGSAPELIIEPGVAVVSDVLKFVGKIVGLKTVQSKNIALVVGSIHNVKPTMTDKQLSMKVYTNESVPPIKKLSAPVDLVGYTCMEHDCLYSSYPHDIYLGDYVVVENMGSYTVVFKPPFIRPNPAIVCYDSLSNEYSLIRRKETSVDVFSTYII